MTTDKPIDFEARLAELNQIVERMEQEPLTLEESLEHFKRGISLTQHCQQALQQAEQTIQTLTAELSLAENTPIEGDPNS